jgi:hypothetical protein
MAGMKNATYRSDEGLIFAIRISSLDLAVAGNVDPGGVPTLQIYNRRSTRQLGPKVRRLKLVRLLRAGDEAAGIPDQYAYRYVTILTKAIYDGFDRAAQVNYDGKLWRIDSGQPEDFKVG